VEVGDWILEGLDNSPLTEDAYDYLRGRGATDDLIERWRIRVWDPPLTPCPDRSIHEYYGAHFDRFEGKIIYPLWSPKGRFLGFDSRHPGKKDEVRYLLQESRWNPVWIGMPDAMDRIWKGADVVIVEGRADLWAMVQVLAANGSDKAVLGSATAHLSWKQVEFLQRWFGKRGDSIRYPHVWMVYDNDEAGKKGTEDAIKHLGNRKVSCSRLRYGEPKDDPGALWDRGGVQLLQKYFHNL
jgi:DNA primase